MFENWDFEHCRSHCRGEEMHYSAGIRKQKRGGKKRSVNSKILIETFKYLKKKDESMRESKLKVYFFSYIYNFLFRNNKIVLILLYIAFHQFDFWISFFFKINKITFLIIVINARKLLQVFQQQRKFPGYLKRFLS